MFLLLEVGPIILYYKTIKGTILAGEIGRFPQMGPVDTPR